jgi:hypothetical protein
MWLHITRQTAHFSGTQFPMNLPSLQIRTINTQKILLTFRLHAENIASDEKLVTGRHLYAKPVAGGNYTQLQAVYTLESIQGNTSFKWACKIFTFSIMIPSVPTEKRNGSLWFNGKPRNIYVSFLALFVGHIQYQQPVCSASLVLVHDAMNVLYTKLAHGYMTETHWLVNGC